MVKSIDDRIKSVDDVIKILKRKKKSVRESGSQIESLDGAIRMLQERKKGIDKKNYFNALKKVRGIKYLIEDLNHTKGYRNLVFKIGSEMEKIRKKYELEIEKFSYETYSSLKEEGNNHQEIKRIAKEQYGFEYPNVLRSFAVQYGQHVARQKELLEWREKIKKESEGLPQDIKEAIKNKTYTHMDLIRDTIIDQIDCSLIRGFFIAAGRDDENKIFYNELLAFKELGENDFLEIQGRDGKMYHVSEMRKVYPAPKE